MYMHTIYLILTLNISKIIKNKEKCVWKCNDARGEGVGYVIFFRYRYQKDMIFTLTFLNYYYIIFLHNMIFSNYSAYRIIKVTILKIQ